MNSPYEIVPNHGTKPFFFDGISPEDFPTYSKKIEVMDGFVTHLADYDDPPVRVYFRKTKVMLIQINRSELHLFHLAGAPINPMNPQEHPSFKEFPETSSPLGRKVELYSSLNIELAYEEEDEFEMGVHALYIITPEGIKR